MIMKKVFPALGLCAVCVFIACGSNTGSVTGFVPRGNFSNASLSGQYVYQVSGLNFSANANGDPYREAGVFVTDGNGHITSGIDDFAEGTGGVATNAITGTYALSVDGTGILTLTGAAGTTLNFAVTLVSSAKLYLIEGDGTLNASGLAEKQDSSAISSVPSGAFAFRTHSLNSLQLPSGNVGQMTIANGAISGSEDVNRNGASSSLTLTGGSFTNPDTTGRGQVSITDSLPTTTGLIYYVVDANNLRFLSSDAGTIGLGRAEKQTGTLALSGSYAFGSSGDTNNFGINGVQSVGRFSADGNGNISAGALDSVEDGNSIANASFSGTYTVVARNGRTSVSFKNGAVQEVFWMVSPSRGFLLINATNKVEDGTLDLQQTSALANSTMNGQFALTMDGFDLNTSAFLSRVGTLQWNGSGNLILNEAVNSGAGAQTGIILSGTYSVSSNGRTTGTISNLSLTNNDLIFYLISGNDAYVLENDAGTEISGTISKQQ
jgi:hypothetical protein